MTASQFLILPFLSLASLSLLIPQSSFPDYSPNCTPLSLVLSQRDFDTFNCLSFPTSPSIMTHSVEQGNSIWMPEHSMDSPLVKNSPCPVTKIYIMYKKTLIMYVCVCVCVCLLTDTVEKYLLRKGQVIVCMCLVIRLSNVCV